MSAITDSLVADYLAFRGLSETHTTFVTDRKSHSASSSELLTNRLIELAGSGDYGKFEKLWGYVKQTLLVPGTPNAANCEVTLLKLLISSAKSQEDKDKTLKLLANNQTAAANNALINIFDPKGCNTMGAADMTKFKLSLTRVLDYSLSTRSIPDLYAIRLCEFRTSRAQIEAMLIKDTRHEKAYKDKV